MKKILGFTHRGETVRVSMDKKTFGHIISHHGHKFSLPHPSWRIIGFSTHHMQNRPIIRLEDVTDPKQIVGTYVWDVDHGTVREWMGSYGGKLPKVTNAWFEASGRQSNPRSTNWHNGWSFYHEFDDKSKRKSSGNVVAVIMSSGRLTHSSGGGYDYVYDAVGAVYYHPNSAVAGTSVSSDYLREKCKRISWQKVENIHPMLVEYLRG